MVRSRRLTLVVLAAVALAASCRASTEVAERDGPEAPSPTEVASPEPDPTAVAGSSPFPEVMPDDFEASYGGDGGMAPWSESLEIGVDAAKYSVWMNGVEYVFEFEPDRDRVAEVYRRLRDGRFDLYERVEFAEGEMIYDAGGQYWSARAGTVWHRLSTSGHDIASPGTSEAPLAALSRFVDFDSVPAATTRAVVVLDPSVEALWDVVVTFLVYDSDLAVGDDRWTDRLDIGLTAQSVAVEVIAEFGDETELQPEPFFGEIAITDGTEVMIALDVDGRLSVTAS